MNWRDHYVADQRPDWAHPRRAAGRRDPSARVYAQGFRRGFIAAMALYALGSVVLLLGFRALGVTP